MLKQLKNTIYTIIAILSAVVVGAVIHPQTIQASNTNSHKSEEEQLQQQSNNKSNPNIFNANSNKNQLVFDGHYLMLYIQNDPNNNQFSDPHKSHRYDAYLNGSCGLWTKPLYDNADGYYKHHGYKLMNHHTARVLALEQVPFRIFRSYHHGELASQSFLIGNRKFFGWIDPDGLYQYKGKQKLPVTYTNNRAERKAYKLAYGNPHFNDYSYKPVSRYHHYKTSHKHAHHYIKHNKRINTRHHLRNKKKRSHKTIRRRKHMKRIK